MPREKLTCIFASAGMRLRAPPAARLAQGFADGFLTYQNVPQSEIAKSRRFFDCLAMALAPASGCWPRVNPGAARRIHAATPKNRVLVLANFVCDKTAARPGHRCTPAPHRCTGRRFTQHHPVAARHPCRYRVMLREYASNSPAAVKSGRSSMDTSVFPSAWPIRSRITSQSRSDTPYAVA